MPKIEAEFSVSEELATPFQRLAGPGQGRPLEEVICRETAFDHRLAHRPRYAGGGRSKAFFANVPPDMRKASRRPGRPCTSGVAGVRGRPGGRAAPADERRRTGGGIATWR
ncbi:hypothetical protein ACPA9J_31925 [Pseudomonas aeruginosa]